MAAVVLGTALTAGTDAARADATSGRPDAATNAPPPRAVEAISRYCQACWRNARLPADRWGDCTQQVFTRLLQSLAPAKWPDVLAADGDERREFVRAIDAVKKRTQRARKAAGLTPDVPDRKPTVDADLRDRREAVAAAADEVLSSRQRQIVEMTAGGWAVPDIAAELGTTTERVSDEKYKAIRKLRTRLGVDGE